MYISPSKVDLSKEKKTMYAGLGAGVTTVATGAALFTLPSTGSNLILNVAISVASGMIAWGVLYVRGR